MNSKAAALRHDGPGWGRFRTNTAHPRVAHDQASQTRARERVMATAAESGLFVVREQ